MRITFLGTSSGVPTLCRNVSSVALERKPGGEIWLFDCGDGTQRQLQKARLSPGQLRRIFITHMHGDHVLGLLGLLSTLNITRAVDELDVYGPAELEEFIAHAHRLTHATPSFRLRVHAIDPAVPVLDTRHETVQCAPLNHRVPAWGYRVETKGPHHASFAYCTDTSFSQTCVELAREVDVLVHESTYADAHSHLATERGHATARDAARTARLANVRRLFLTHLSPRYTPNSKITDEQLLCEARSEFSATDLARDFMDFEFGTSLKSKDREGADTRAERSRRQPEAS